MNKQLRTFLPAWPVALDGTQQAYCMFRRYYVVTELFDRTVCSLRSVDGVALPSSDLQRELVTRHARERRRELIVALSQLDITDDEARRGQYLASKQSIEKLIQEEADSPSA